MTDHIATSGRRVLRAAPRDPDDPSSPYEVVKVLNDAVMCSLCAAERDWSNPFAEEAIFDFFRGLPSTMNIISDPEVAAARVYKCDHPADTPWLFFDSSDDSQKLIAPGTPPPYFDVDTRVGRHHGLDYSARCTYGRICSICTLLRDMGKIPSVEAERQGWN